MLGFGKKQPQQAQMMMKGDITPEEKEMLKRIYWRSSEIYSRTFLPLVLQNRQLVISHLHEVKKDVDSLLKVI